MFIADRFTDYEILDCGDGEKLERWGDVLLARPDPLVVWPRQRPELWGKAAAHYIRSESGGGRWEFAKKLPDRWSIGYDKLSFYVRPTGFKHTGLFPEQSVNWDFMAGRIRSFNGTARVLNLFAYTGGATLACAQAGAQVCHVDSAKSMVTWARENAELSHLAEKPIRYIVDDCLKFVLREQRRGSKYDAIVMDPPSYGRGADGQVWKMERDIYGLVAECAKLMSDTPLFFLLNSYTTGLSSVVTSNILKLCLPGGTVDAGDVALPITGSGTVLPCGTAARWTP